MSIGPKTPECRLAIFSSVSGEKKALFSDMYAHARIMGFYKLDSASVSGR